jgi:hypothetical protein
VIKPLSLDKRMDASEPLTAGAPSSRTSSGSMTPNKRLNDWVESKNLSIDTDSILAREERRQLQINSANQAIRVARKTTERRAVAVRPPKNPTGYRGVDDTADHSSCMQSSTTKNRPSSGCFSSFWTLCKR